MYPLLKFAEDENEHSIKEAYESLANRFELTPDDKNELLPSGTQNVYKNRIGWARTYLKKAGLLDSPKRGYLKITNRGKELLNKNLSRIDNQLLKQFDEFNEFQQRSKDIKEENEIDEEYERTPEERLESAIDELNQNLSTELLDSLSSASPNFFENVVVELLVKMGYGGSRKEAGQVVGRSGDGGIDGIIKEDKLGLDIIYIQAKKWENVVSRPEIQKFVGALQGRRAKKGIFITTSRFSKEATEYVEMIDNKVILIDGAELTKLMIENEVGVTRISTHYVRRLDSDYFLEE